MHVANAKATGPAVNCRGAADWLPAPHDAPRRVRRPRTISQPPTTAAVRREIRPDGSGRSGRWRRSTSMSKTSFEHHAAPIHADRDHHEQQPEPGTAEAAVGHKVSHADVGHGGKNARQPQQLQPCHQRRIRAKGRCAHKKLNAAKRRLGWRPAADSGWPDERRRRGGRCRDTVRP